MFDISFAEMMLIGVVALLVIGPEKLPQVARTAGAFIGRLQRYVAQVKEEVNRDERFEELQKLQQEIKQGVNQAETSMMAGMDDVKSTLTAAEKSTSPKTRKTATVKKAGAKPTATKKKTTAKKSATKKAKASPKKTKGKAKS